MPHSNSSNSDSQELKQLASLVHGRSTPDAISAEALLEKLKYHGITLLAAEHSSLPLTLAPAIMKHKAMMVANDTLKQIELAKLFSALNAANIKSVLIKGSALAYSIYPTPWLRPRSDSDVLIAASDRAQVDDICGQLGYQKLFAIQGKYVSYQSTYGRALAGGSTINIDLHWHINNRQMFSNTLPVDELVQNGQPLKHFYKTPLNGTVTIPSRIDSILIASVHRAGHHNKEERIVWLYDIHLLANSLSENEWQQLCHKASTKQISAITLDALNACQTLLGTEVSNTVLQQLGQSSEKDEPSAIFLNRELPEWRYFWADLKSMPSLGSKFGFIRESSIPSPEYVRLKMNTSWASWGYLKRFYRGIKRIF